MIQTVGVPESLRKLHENTELSQKNLVHHQNLWLDSLMTVHVFGKLKHLIDVARQKAREHHTSRVNNNKTNYGKN